MMRKVSVKEPVRMVFRALMLVNVQKRRLKKRKRQHEVHQYGNERPHTHIVPFYCLFAPVNPVIPMTYFALILPTLAVTSDLMDKDSAPSKLPRGRTEPGTGDRPANF